MGNDIPDEEYYWNLAIALEGRRSDIESVLPEINDAVFREYSLVLELLAVLYERLKGGL